MMWHPIAATIAKSAYNLVLARIGDAMSDLYETDFAVWANEQAQAIRDHLDGGNRPVDWAHIIEEIESLGASDRRELRNRLRTIMVHLFKLRFANDVAPRQGWIDTVIEQRVQLETLLDENRSLRATVDAIISRDIDAARAAAEDALARHGDSGTIDPDATFTVGQVLDKWLP